MPFIVTASRTILFLLFQALIAFFFTLSGSERPWKESEGWWTFSVLFTNAVSIVILIRLLKRQGKKYFEVFRFTPDGWWKDLLISLAVLAVSAPVATLPSQWLSVHLLGSAEESFRMMFRPLPLWAGIVSLAFPLTHAFAELPTYFGYDMPELKKKLKNGWAAWAIASFFLALQHAALPFIPDIRFILWRVGMFLPFALYIGLILKWRPRLMPYLMIGHALIDLPVVLMILALK